MHTEWIDARGGLHAALHVGKMDPSTHFENLVRQVATVTNASGFERQKADPDEPSWDVICGSDLCFWLQECLGTALIGPADPVSQFLESYHLPLAAPAHTPAWADGFRIAATSSKLDFIRQRRLLSLSMEHRGIIWTTVAFTASVVKWELPSPPPPGVQRHRIKEASSHGSHLWTLELEIQLDPDAFSAATRNAERGKGQRQGPAERLGQLQIDFQGRVALSSHLRSVR